MCHNRCHNSKCFCSMHTPICQKLKKIDSHIINSSYLPPNEPNDRNYKSIALERTLRSSSSWPSFFKGIHLTYNTGTYYLLQTFFFSFFLIMLIHFTNFRQDCLKPFLMKKFHLINKTLGRERFHNKLLILSKAQCLESLLKTSSLFCLR